MLANNYVAQRYFIRADWEAFEKQMNEHLKEGFLLTSVTSYYEGFAGVMSKVRGWHHPIRSTHWISSLKEGERDIEKEGAITSILFREKMAHLNSHEGTGITGQYLLKTLAHRPTDEFLEDIRQKDYFLTEITRSEEETFMVLSAGLGWEQAITLGTLNDLDDESEIESKEGRIVTEFFSYDLLTYTMVFSSNTGYTEQFIIRNPGAETFDASYFRQGYRITMVRGVRDDLYVFLSR